MFDGKIFLIKSLILLEDKCSKITNIFHQNLSHLGINMPQYKIEREIYLLINYLIRLKKM